MQTLYSVDVIVIYIYLTQLTKSVAGETGDGQNQDIGATPTSEVQIG